MRVSESDLASCLERKTFPMETTLKSAQNSSGWQAPLLAFLCGIAITAALLVPIQSPDYQRGFTAGYVDGKHDAEKCLDANFEFGFHAGVRSVRSGAGPDDREIKPVKNVDTSDRRVRRSDQI